MAKIKPKDDDKCIQCNVTFNVKQIEKEEFYYSRTKRKTTMFLHKKCWVDIPKHGVSL